MANDIVNLPWLETGDTIYTIIRDLNAGVADQVAGAEPFVTQVNGNWGNYDFPAPETPSGGYNYQVTFPSWISAGIYDVTFYLQSGGSPAISDTPIATRVVEWDGSAIRNSLPITDKTGFKLASDGLDTVTLIAAFLAQFVTTNTEEPSAASGSVAKLAQGDTNIALTGANSVTITVDDGADPIQDAKVRVTKGAETEVRSTSVDGQVVFSLDDGSWTINITRYGFTFNETTLTVNGTESETYSMTQYTPSAPSSPFINMILQCYNSSGEVNGSATISVTQIGTTTEKGHASISGPTTYTANGSGLVSVPVIPGATYKIAYDDSSIYREQEIPLDAEDGDSLGSIYG